MRRIVLGMLILVACAPAAFGGETINTAIRNEKLFINGNETPLGPAHWAEPEQSWRTVAELSKGVLPPMDDKGQRPNVVLQVEMDPATSWGALKTVLLAAAHHAIGSARVVTKGGGEFTVKLPGALASGDVVDFALVAGDGDDPLTENGGKRLKVTPALAAGLVKQQPKAIIVLKAPLTLPAVKTLRALRVLEDAKANVSFLPIKAVTAEEAAARKTATDAVNRALGGLDPSK